MKQESAYLGSGVYAEVDQYETVKLSYGGKGAPSVVLNRASLENLWVFVKIKNQGDDGPGLIDGGMVI